MPEPKPPLSGLELREEQARTLATPRRRYGIVVRSLLWLLDLMLGRRETLSKMKALELVARVPYQAWEQVAYLDVGRHGDDVPAARRIFDQVREARAQQDTEQWHLLLLEELTRQLGARESAFRHRVLPQVIAFVYYALSWWLRLLAPAVTYRLNADFEDHAEHTYMELVRDHPELEHVTFTSEVAAEYGSFASVSDLLRRIALDEREHKEESLAAIAARGT